MAETQPLELSEERTFTYRLCAGLVQVLSKVLFRRASSGPKHTARGTGHHRADSPLQR